MTSDEKAIHDIVRQLENTWNASDSKGWASLFAEDATFIHIYGGQLDGRAAVEGAHRAIFDTIYKGSRMSAEIRNIRLLRPDVAVILDPRPGGDIPGERRRHAPNHGPGERAREVADRCFSEHADLRSARRRRCRGEAGDLGGLRSQNEE